MRTSMNIKFDEYLSCIRMWIDMMLIAIRNKVEAG